MQFAGHFLVWFAGGASSVLDLSTGNGFDVAGTVTGTEGSIVIAELPANPGTKGGLIPTHVSRVPTGGARHHWLPVTATRRARTGWGRNGGCPVGLHRCRACS